MASVKDLDFGCHSSDIPNAPAMWGARAIYQYDRHKHSYYVDLLWDRQNLIGDSDEAKEVLKEKLNGGGIKAFCEWAKDKFDSADRTVHNVNLNGIRFYGSTNASHGYLYITAFIDRFTQP